MHLLIVVGDMSLNSGGVTRVVLNFVKEVLEIISPIQKITLAYTYPSSNDKPLPYFQDERIDEFCFKRIGPQRFGYSPDFCKFMNNSISKYTLIHFHGIWDHCILYTAKLAIRHNLPYLFSAHGMLNSWSINQSKLSKKIWAIWHNINVIFGKSYGIIYATIQEKEDVERHFKMIRNHFIIPNGLLSEDLNYDKIECRKKLLDRINIKESNAVIFTFFSRIHHKKNPFNLLKAFHQLNAVFSNTRLLFLGIEDDNQLSDHLKRYVEENQMQENVIFENLLLGKDARRLMAGCDFMVLPSHQEGFSMAVLEALACGLPVVLSKYCNFNELEQIEVGFICDTDVDSIEESMHKCMKLSHNDYLSMSNKAKTLVAENYTQAIITKKTLLIYNKINDND